MAAVSGARERRQGRREHACEREKRIGKRGRGSRASSWRLQVVSSTSSGNQEVASAVSCCSATHLLGEKTNEFFVKSPSVLKFSWKLSKQHYLPTLLLVLQPFEISKLFKEVENNQWPFLTSIERSTYLILSFECLTDISK
jgi:hypothetical protein